MDDVNPYQWDLLDRKISADRFLEVWAETIVNVKFIGKVSCLENGITGFYSISIILLDNSEISIPCHGCEQRNMILGGLLSFIREDFGPENYLILKQGN